MPGNDAMAHLPLQPAAFEVLLSLADGALHGYALIAEIRRRTGGRVVLGTSTLYAVLHRLRRDGLVEEAPSGEPSGGAPRRAYRLTASGRKVLKLEALRLQDVAERARRGVLARGRRGESG
jgi:DNA-binding PadR family transcriptional regulator